MIDVRGHEVCQTAMQPFLCATAGPLPCSSSSQLSAPSATARFELSGSAGNRNTNACKYASGHSIFQMWITRNMNWKIKSRNVPQQICSKMSKIKTIAVFMYGK